MMKAFKYRLYPTRKQADALQQTLDLCREFREHILIGRRKGLLSRFGVNRGHVDPPRFGQEK